MKIIPNNMTFLKEIKLSKLHLILIILGLFVLFGATAFIYLQQRQPRFLTGESGQSQGWGQRPGGAQKMWQPPSQKSKTTQFSGIIPEAPKEQLSFYKGVAYGTSFYNYGGEYELFQNPTKLKNLGANIFGFTVEFEINPEGKIRYPLDFPTIKAIDGRIGEIAQKLYEQNIRLWVLVQPNYKENFTREWGGEPKTPPREVYIKPGFYDEYSKAVIEIAKIAQKYHVEMFSPINEPDGAISSIGDDQEIIRTTQKWTDGMLSRTRQVYKGKILYKGDLHQRQGDKLKFSGYDILGIMPAPTLPGYYDATEYRNGIKSNIAKAKKWATRDGVPEVMVAEFGSWGPSIPTNQAQEKYKILFEEAQGLNGIFVNDPPPFGDDYKTKIRNEIKTWFTEKL